MIDDKDVHIQVYREYDGHSIQVLSADGDRQLWHKSWDRNDDELGVGGERNFVELLKFLGYTVYHGEVY